MGVDHVVSIFTSRTLASTVVRVMLRSESTRNGLITNTKWNSNTVLMMVIPSTCTNMPVQNSKQLICPSVSIWIVMVSSVLWLLMSTDRLPERQILLWLLNLSTTMNDGFQPSRTTTWALQMFQTTKISQFPIHHADWVITVPHGLWLLDWTDLAFHMVSMPKRSVPSVMSTTVRGKHDKMVTSARTRKWPLFYLNHLIMIEKLDALRQLLFVKTVKNCLILVMVSLITRAVSDTLVSYV